MPISFMNSLRIERDARVAPDELWSARAPARRSTIRSVRQVRSPAVFEERHMFTRHGRAIALVTLMLVPVAVARQAHDLAAQVPTAADSPRYAVPPKAIVDVFDAEFLPQTMLSPNRQVVALTKARSYSTIAELAQPMLRLAGARVNPTTNGPHRASGLPGTGIYAITLKRIADGVETVVKMPPQARISNVKFSPDG